MRLTRPGRKRSATNSITAEMAEFDQKTAAAGIRCRRVTVNTDDLAAEACRLAERTMFSHR